jgi:putative transposase
MTRPYSSDLRERVVAAVERDGLSRNQAAARFSIAVSTAVHWLRRYHATGDVKPSKIGGHRKKTLRDEHAVWLIARCRERDFTISQLVTELLEVRGLKVDRHTVWDFVHAEHLSFKKKSVRQRAGPSRRRQAA